LAIDWTNPKAYVPGMNDDEPVLEGEDDDGTQKPRPWDPNKIRVGTKPWSLRQIVDEIQDDTIDIAPDFQRAFVWNERQQTQLIESILLGIPLPAFYFNQDKDNRHQVVDGVQRLTTIRDFAASKFPLSFHLEYLTNLEGKTFKHLEPAVKRRFNQTQIVVHVIDASSPYELKFNIFKRINTGGTRLEPQEIRHCMAKKRARDLLENLVKVADFANATRLAKATRMEDRELALRFVAFRRLVGDGGIEKYHPEERFEDFLNGAMRDLDDINKTPETQDSVLLTAFSRAMTNCCTVFGRRAFRKNPNGGPLNRALFDCWTSALADVPTQLVTPPVVKKIVEAFDQALLTKAFGDSVGFAIGNVDRIRTRFKVAAQIVKDALEV
jgi:Protein of unknown function DUF262